MNIIDKGCSVNQNLKILGRQSFRVPGSLTFGKHLTGRQRRGNSKALLLEKRCKSIDTMSSDKDSKVECNCSCDLAENSGEEPGRRIGKKGKTQRGRVQGRYKRHLVCG